MFISKFISKVIGEKGQWRQYKARTRQLPSSYRTAVEALERYLMYFGTGGGGTAIYEDLIDLFEQSAASGTPIREIVGEDPVEFVEEFVRNVSGGTYGLVTASHLPCSPQRVRRNGARHQIRSSSTGPILSRWP
jgi:DNA-binding ferritin-like protein (Dps family)